MLMMPTLPTVCLFVCLFVCLLMCCQSVIGTHRNRNKRDEEVVLVFGWLIFEIVKQVRAKPGACVCSAWPKGRNSTTTQ